jgi:uncharacterized protein (TIGR00251 family)
LSRAGPRTEKRRLSRIARLIKVHVHPRASRPKAEWKDGVLEVWVSAPPVEGAANAAVLDTVARVLGVRRRAVRLHSGERGRIKTVEVDAD